jgi:RimJ/RimL family protein N-acetyltransferase
MGLDMVSDVTRIVAERLVLRPLDPADAGPVALYVADPRVACMTRTIPHPYPPGAAEAFVARARAPGASPAVWAVDVGARAGGEGSPGLIGCVSLQRLDRGQSEIGYWIAPAFWNAGYATEAVAALMSANPFGDRRWFATVFQDNPGSARVLTHCGFNYLGEADAHCVARNTTLPTWTYSRQLPAA